RGERDGVRAVVIWRELERLPCPVGNRLAVAAGNLPEKRVRVALSGVADQSVEGDQVALVDGLICPRVHAGWGVVNGDAGGGQAHQSFQVGDPQLNRHGDRPVEAEGREGGPGAGFVAAQGGGARFTEYAVAVEVPGITQRVRALVGIR